MFGYYLELALRSLKRSPGLTALMVLAIGFGVAASMTTYAVFRAVSGDPIPWKSSKLFVPQIDMWGPTARDESSEPPDALDYTDAMALMRDHRADRQSASYAISPSVIRPHDANHPLIADGGGVEASAGHAVFSEFFPMLDVPFAFGSSWTSDDDAHQSAVVVISNELNQEMFGGLNSVGRSLEIDGKDYRVVGVLKEWSPQPRFYDIFDTDGFVSGQEDVFVPFTRAIAVNMANGGRNNCQQEPTEPGFVGLQKSSCLWIEYMVELDSASAVQMYRQYLDNYAHEQQQLGRFSWAPNNRLRDVPAFLDYEQVVPTDTKVSLLVALGLLVVCLVNTVGLLLAKFLRRSGEIGVRRALGAARRAIYSQFLVEAGLIGAVGGVLGLLLTFIGVASIGLVLPRDIASLAKIDASLLASTVVVAMSATVLAALYPTFRASRVQPAWQLKSN